MLVLSRRLNEKILLPSIHTSVEVLDIKGDRVRLGIEAPTSVTILREELAERQAAEGKSKSIGDDNALGRRSAESRAAMSANLEAAEAVTRKQRHQFRNHLNSATIGLALVQRQLQAGQLAQAESTLAKITTGVGHLTEQLEQLMPSAEPATSGTVKRLERGRSGLRKALLVEDDNNESELLAGLLRMAGYDVATASDGDDAIDYLHHHECPDFLLVDMVLPRCDGPTTIRRLRDEPAFNDLRIYAISGMTPDQVGFDYRASGVARWFQKPLKPELLLRELSAIQVETVAV